MNNPVLLVLNQIIGSPVISTTISLLILIWVYFFHLRIDATIYSYCYNDVLVRQQYWKIFTSPFCNATFFQLLLNIITLWGIRSLEVLYGSWFIFRYTLLLIVVQPSLIIFFTFLIITLSNMTQQGLSSMSSLNISNHPLRTVTTLGTQGLLLSWLAYQSVKMDINVPFYFLGFLPVPFVLAPLLLIFISPVFGNKLNGLVNTVSLICGYLLGFGVLQILPDMYWSLCFTLNVFLFLLLKLPYFHTTMVVILNNNRNIPGNTTGNNTGSNTGHNAHDESVNGVLDTSTVQGGDEDVLEFNGGSRDNIDNLGDIDNNDDITSSTFNNLHNTHNISSIINSNINTYNAQNTHNIMNSNSILSEPSNNFNTNSSTITIDSFRAARTVIPVYEGTYSTEHGYTPGATPGGLRDMGNGSSDIESNSNNSNNISDSSSYTNNNMFSNLASNMSSNISDRNGRNNDIENRNNQRNGNGNYSNSSMSHDDDDEEEGSFEGVNNRNHRSKSSSSSGSSGSGSIRSSSRDESNTLNQRMPLIRNTNLSSSSNSSNSSNRNVSPQTDSINKSNNNNNNNNIERSSRHD